MTLQVAVEESVKRFSQQHRFTIGARLRDKKDAQGKCWKSGC